MEPERKDIIARLRREIMPLQGSKIPLREHRDSVLPGTVLHAFGEHRFPTGAVHEFLYRGSEAAAATTGFIAALVGSLMRETGTAIWIGACREIFPPALKLFGLAPDRVIFIDVEKQKDISWVMEQALQCEGISAVVGELAGLGFTASRRFQLAVEHSGVTAFVLHAEGEKLPVTACYTRWRITPLASGFQDDMPGLGFPRWSVDLVKVRNGWPGNWQMEWVAGRFRQVNSATTVPQEHKKTG
jgi:protein ImuA